MVMTEVYTEKDGSRYTIYAKGHATGSEACCAAISGILYALLGYLVNAEKAGEAEILERRMEPGNVAIEYRGGEESGGAFYMAAIGLAQLQESYPGTVLVTAREI